MPETKSPSPIGWLVLLVRVILAGLFILAGTLKLSNPQAFTDAILAFKIVQKLLPEDTADHLVIVSTFVVPWTEIVAGVCLLLGLWARAASLVISLLLLVFIAAIASALLRGLDTKCGCFGRFEWPCGDKVGACQLTRDAIMLAMGVFLVLKGPGPLAIDRESTK